MKLRTVEILDWPEMPERTPVNVEVTCDRCSADLLIPAAQGVRVIATTGMGMIHDNTPRIPHGMPSRVRCPRCLTIYTLDREEVPA